MIQVTEKQRREVESRFTKYEIARILGARALQVSMNAPILLKISKDELETINYDPLKIAEIEFYASILPITVKRPMPKRLEETAVKKPVEVKEEIVEMKQEKEKPKNEKEKRSVIPEILKAEPAKEQLPQPEEGTLEDVEQTEIMELATPADEAEEEPAAEEAGE